MVLCLDLVNHQRQRKVVKGEVELWAPVLRRLAKGCPGRTTATGPGGVRRLGVGKRRHPSGGGPGAYKAAVKVAYILKYAARFQILRAVPIAWGGQTA